MHICQVIDAFTQDGAQRVVLNFARQARERGIHVSAIGLMESSSDVMWNDLRSLDVKLSLSITQKLYDPGRMVRLARELRRQKVDLIQSHLSYANILAPAVGRLAGIPVVSTLHTAHYRNQYYRQVIFRTEMAMLRYLSHGAIAVARAVKEVYSPFIGEEKIRVLPNPVNPVPAVEDLLVKQIRGQYLPEPAGPLLISVGRLAKPKGYDDLIAAFQDIYNSLPEARLLIAGRGDLRVELEKQIDQAGLNGRVFLVGERSDIPALLAAADLYVSASRWEGMPLSILEAMSAGKAVVATAVGGVPEILAGRGVLVPSGQPQALAAAVIDLLRNPVRLAEFGRAGRIYADENHSPRLWMDELLRIYHDCGMHKRNQ